MAGTRARILQKWRSGLLTAALFAIALVTGLAASVPFTIAPANAQEGGLKARERTVSITASGQVTAVPDIASITTGVVSEAKTAKAAVEANGAAMRDVIAALKTANVADRDVQTSDFSVQPKYTYPQDGTNTPPQLVGYTVSNKVAIRVREIKRIGEVLDAVVNVGSNQISGISFSVSKSDELLDKARQVAVAAARRKAGIYAEAAGVKLGPVLLISEGSQQAPAPQMVRQMAMADKASSVPVEAGELALAVDVTVVWAIE
jgi:uncharacterized protein